MIPTIHGPMDESLLERRDGADEDERARVEWVEYWVGGEMVHRSAHIALKKGFEMKLEQGAFGG